MIIYSANRKINWISFYKRAKLVGNILLGLNENALANFLNVFPNYQFIAQQML